MTDRSLLRDVPSALGAKVRGGELAATELVGVALAAIEADDSTLGCFIAVDAERALEEAAAVDAAVAAGKDPGPLAGVPLGVKDNEDAVGYVTTVGSAWRRSDPPATR